MATATSETRKDEFHVLPESQGGGPLGLGNPDDLSLRRVEREVLIPKIMKVKAHKEKCTETVEAFTKCGVEQGFLLPFLCRKESRELNNCLTKWYHDEQFREECTNIYLNDRSMYRRTGERTALRRM